MKTISELTSELKNKIENSEIMQSLLIYEKEMENNEEVMALSYRYSCAQVDYSDLLKYYKEDSDEVRNAQKKLYESKLKLETHPVVKKYLDKYQELKDLYREIENELFERFDLNHLLSFNKEYIRCVL